jgi:hypothetical protein
MKAVIQTQTFLASAREAGMSNEEQADIVNTIAAEPSIGDLMAGTGGCRKRRFPGRGKGKRGGYRTVNYNGADDVPVLLLALIDKGERDNLSHEEGNQLRKALATYEEEYRTNAAAQAAKIKGGR